MRSNSKQVRAAARAYLIDCIMSVNAADLEIKTDDLKTRLQYIVSDFRRVTNNPYDLHRLPNDQDRFIDWLQGLPNCIPIDFENFMIIEVLTSWGLPDDKDYPMDKIARLYYYIIYSELTKLLKANDIEL